MNGTLSGIKVMFMYRSQECSGFRVQDSVAVTFNVIVPRDYWLWDVNTKMYLRFGNPNLGKWKDVGIFDSHQ